MNVKEYISSGILEAYALGQLSFVERGEVEQAMANNSEIREELDRVEQTLEALAFATAKDPSSDVKSRLLEGIENEAPVIPMEQLTKSNLGVKYAAAASIVIAIASSLLAFNYWSNWQKAESRLAELVAQNQQFAENYNLVNQQLDGLHAAVSVMNSQDYQRVVMAGTDNAPEALATVYWNESTSDVYLNIQNLKKLSQEQQYQLWAIIDGKPVDAGVFDLESDQVLMAMKSIGDGAAAFAVTIEPKGGSENPTLETMQVLGNV
ncbi:MAG: anti-sigma factor [Bacteroidota bacterium]